MSYNSPKKIKLFYGSGLNTDGYGGILENQENVVDLSLEERVNKWLLNNNKHIKVDGIQITCSPKTDSSYNRQYDDVYIMVVYTETELNGSDNDY